jgi:serine/threonine protein kinase
MGLSPGDRLGPYQIIQLIGAGGMGEVYGGEDTRLKRSVAIKVLTSSLSDDPDAKERFVRKAKAVSSLNHPLVCVLFDVGRQTPLARDTARSRVAYPDFFTIWNEADADLPIIMGARKEYVAPQ